jgi:hypothetical protein
MSTASCKFVDHTKKKNCGLLKSSLPGPKYSRSVPGWGMAEKYKRPTKQNSLDTEGKTTSVEARSEIQIQRPLGNHRWSVVNGSRVTFFFFSNDIIVLLCFTGI